MNSDINAAGQREILASGAAGRILFARIWRGRTRADAADEHLAYLYEHGVLPYEHGVLPIERKPGNLGMQLFRRVAGAVAEFATISYWSSLEAMGDAMHGGDGGDPQRVAHLDRAPDYLLELPESVEITELHANDWRLAPRPT